MFKRRYRIRTETLGSGKTIFYPQQRSWFMWFDFEDNNALAHQKIIKFGTKEQAEDYLVTEYKSLIADKIVRRGTQPFDAVFHALKNE